MEREYAIKQGLALVNKSTSATLGTNGNDGYPNMRSMLKMENDGMKTIWFSTNSSSRKVNQLQRDAKACVYFADSGDGKRMGLMLLGEVEVLQDVESKKRLWREGFEKYYPQGIADPDYTVLRFTSKYCKYYHKREIASFEI